MKFFEGATNLPIEFVTVRLEFPIVGRRIPVREAYFESPGSEIIQEDAWWKLRILSLVIGEKLANDIDCLFDFIDIGVQRQVDLRRPDEYAVFDLHLRRRFPQVDRWEV